jgi:hypothetical protein
MTHNHPNTDWVLLKQNDPSFTGTSFSYSDLQKLCGSDLKEIRAVPNLSDNIVYTLKKNSGNFDIDDLEIMEDIMLDYWGYTVKNTDLLAIFNKRISGLSPEEIAEINSNIYLQWSVVSPELFNLAKSDLQAENILYEVLTQ